MKKILLATVALAALAAPAAAADLAARPTYTKAPVLAPLPSWAGFYLGAVGGYATEDAGTKALKGGFAGGTVGYNWQQGPLVFGLEADAAWADINATVGIPGVFGLTDRIESTGTVRGRIGYAFDTVLLYGTGGYAWGNNKLSATVGGVAGSETKFLSGWAAGAGVEWMFAPKWSLKGEYLYKSLESSTYFGGAVPLGTLNLHTFQVGVNYHF